MFIFASFPRWRPSPARTGWAGERRLFTRYSSSQTKGRTSLFWQTAGFQITTRAKVQAQSNWRRCFHFMVCLFLFVSVPSICFTDQILDLLIPEEEADMSDLILEVTAGVGGQEAMLFTAEVWNDLYPSVTILHCSYCNDTIFLNNLKDFFI